MDMKIENLNLAALKYFLDSVELGSITLSSEKNHISRPAVSQAILRLEQWHGKQLLKHEKRSFELTDNGREFYKLAKRAYANLSESFVNGLELEKTFKVGCTASLIELIFPKLVTVIDKCPAPFIKIGTTSSLLELLKQKQINLAFLIGSEKVPSYRTKIIHEGRFDLRSISGNWQTLVITTERRPEVEAFLRYSVKEKKVITKHIEVESWTAAQRIAEMTSGMCLVPDYIPKGKLQSVRSKAWSFSYEALIVSQNDALLSPLESDLLNKFKA